MNSKEIKKLIDEYCPAENRLNLSHVSLNTLAQLNLAYYAALAYELNIREVPYTTPPYSRTYTGLTFTPDLTAAAPVKVTNH